MWRLLESLRAPIAWLRLTRTQYGVHQEHAFTRHGQKCDSSTTGTPAYITQPTWGARLLSAARAHEGTPISKCSMKSLLHSSRTLPLGDVVWARWVALVLISIREGTVFRFVNALSDRSRCKSRARVSKHRITFCASGNLETIDRASNVPSTRGIMALSCFGFRGGASC